MPKLFFAGFSIRSKQGQMALPFILLVSGIIIEITIAGALIAYFLSNSGLSERLLLRAEATAKSGINDAFERISLDKEYAPNPISYSFSVGQDTAQVSVSRVLNNPANIYVYTITSLGIASSREKRFSATIVVDQTSGLSRLKSLTETIAP